MNEGYFQIDDMNVFYREAGSGEPIVLVHCAGGTCGQWRKLMDRMSDRYRLLAFDLLSHGKSDKMPADTDNEFEIDVQTLSACVELVGKPVHLVGHSTGGGAAARFAIAKPDHVQSLVLFEPVLFQLIANGVDDDGWNDYLRLITGLIENIEAGNEAGAAEVLVDYWSVPGAFRSLSKEQQHKVINGVRSATEKGRKLLANPAEHSIDASQIQAPTLLLSGDKSPRSARGVINILAKSIKRAELCRIVGGGHMSPLTHADEVNALIEKHIEAYST